MIDESGQEGKLPGQGEPNEQEGTQGGVVDNHINRHSGVTQVEADGTRVTATGMIVEPYPRQKYEPGTPNTSGSPTSSFTEAAKPVLDGVLGTGQSARTENARATKPGEPAGHGTGEGTGGTSSGGQA